MLTSAFYTNRNTDVYNGINTAEVIELLQNDGWIIKDANQRSSRKNHEEALHVARLWHQNYKISDTEDIELVIKNSHDGSSMFEARIGIYRMVCSNGLVVGNDIVEPMKIPHSGWLSNHVVEAIDLYFSMNHSKIDQLLTNMKHKIVDMDTKFEFAEKAFYLKHKDIYKPENPIQLVTPTRKEDIGDDAWTVYNVVQSHLIEGDYHIVSDGKARKARTITSPAREYELNVALNDLAYEILI